MSKIGIVYAKNSKLVRRIIVPDHESELLNPAHVQSGEAIVVLPYAKIDGPTAALVVAAETGISVEDIPSGRCALVDGKTRLVSGVVMADPEIDTHDGGEVIASERADVNWKHDGEKFLARFVVATVQAATDPKAMVVPARVEQVVWLDPDAKQSPVDGMKLLADSHAEIGDIVMVLQIVEVASAGTVKL